MSVVPPGIYESLLTEGLSDRLARLQDSAFRTLDVPGGEDPQRLTAHLSAVIKHALETEENVGRRVELAQRIIDLLGEDYRSESPDVRNGLSTLAEIRRFDDPSQEAMIRPESALSDAALLTNSAHEPSLGAELRAEIETADRVDLLCAFVKWHGLRVLEIARIGSR